MSEHRDALFEIANMCITSRTYTRRIQSIHNTAMVALGMTEPQRNKRHAQAVEFSENHKKKHWTGIPAKKEMKAAPCPGCYSSDCNGECMGCGLMGG